MARNLRNEERRVNLPHSDALVFFGATGDLIYKRIIPALYAMERRAISRCPSSGSPGRIGRSRSFGREPSRASKMWTTSTLRSSRNSRSGSVTSVATTALRPPRRPPQGTRQGGAPVALSSHPSDRVRGSDQGTRPVGLRSRRAHHSGEAFGRDLPSAQALTRASQR